LKTKTPSSSPALNPSYSANYAQNLNLTHMG
jgi:hypothetical protein